MCKRRRGRRNGEMFPGKEEKKDRFYSAFHGQQHGAARSKCSLAEESFCTVSDRWNGLAGADRWSMCWRIARMLVLPCSHPEADRDPSRAESCLLHDRWLIVDSVGQRQMSVVPDIQRYLFCSCSRDFVHLFLASCSAIPAPCQW